MKRLLILHFMLCLSSSIISQSQWYFQNPYPHDNNINSVTYVSADAIYATGDWGTVIKSTDGGANWKFLETKFHDNLNSLFFFDKNTGFACGDDGKLIFTSDGGNSWLDRSINTGNNFEIIYFYNRNNGVIGGTSKDMYRTTDGGITWNKVTVADASFANCVSISFVNDKTGFAVGDNGSNAKTTDGGLTWSNAGLPIKSSDYNEIKFTSDKIGYFIAVGAYSNYLYQTTDAGNSWIDKSADLQGVSPTSIAFANSNLGFIIGQYSYNGAVLKTTNGGNSWTRINIIYRDRFLDKYLKVATLNNSNAIFVGSRGMIFTSNDGGNYWVSRSKDLNTISCTSVAFYNDKVGYAFGGAYFIKTIDGGSNWIKNILQGVVAIEVGGAKALSEKIIVAVGTSMIIGDNSNSIIKSTDGGLTWGNKSDASQSKLTLNDLHFANESFGIAVGDKGTILATNNSGDIWTSLQSGVTSDLKDVYMLNANIGYIVGGSGTILKTTNGGANWTKLNTGLTGTFSKVVFTSENNGYAVLSDDIYITKNAGLTWTKQITLNETIRDIFFSNSQNGIAIGSKGLIARTTDVGLTWNYEESHTESALYNIAFLASNNFTIVGEEGIILNSLKGMHITYVQSSKEIIPQKIELMQNYPNPFNPSTTINYQITEPGYVTLKVYDLLGRVITTLEEGYKTAGNYNSFFKIEGGNVSSGIYFYTLQSSNYSLSKKMILLK